jgi:hypothetical protein
MATEERRFSPVAVLVHVVAIGFGLYLGWIAMQAISPDLPDPSVQPGVQSAAEVAGDAPNSLFRGPYLQGALNQLSDQMAAGEGIVTMHIEPGTLDTETASGEGLFQPEDVSSETPVVLIHTIDSERGGPPIGLGEVSYMDLVATEKGPRWYVQLDIDREIGPPPWTYGAPLEGTPLTVGQGPPEPLG